MLARQVEAPQAGLSRRGPALYEGRCAQYAPAVQALGAVQPRARAVGARGGIQTPSNRRSGRKPHKGGPLPGCRLAPSHHMRRADLAEELVQDLVSGEMAATDNTALCSRSPPGRGVTATALAVVERTLVFDHRADEAVLCVACEGRDCSMERSPCWREYEDGAGAWDP